MTNEVDLRYVIGRLAAFYEPDETRLTLRPSTALRVTTFALRHSTALR
jgi:hypothetical protein